MNDDVRPPVTRPSAAAFDGEVPLVAHIIHRFDIGGLENGVVNLINHMPAERYRHAVIALTEYTDFHKRILRTDVKCYAVGKRPGKDPKAYKRLWTLLRKLRPDIVHTRNLPTIDAQVVAAVAGVPCRVHGEHGRDVIDLDGTRRKYVWLRRALDRFIHRYIPLSRDLEEWLSTTVRVRPGKITRIYNGVDSNRFRPSRSKRLRLPVAGLVKDDSIVIGTVGRMADVKDQLTLVRAFLRLLDEMPEARQRFRLVIIGDGPLHGPASDLLRSTNAENIAWFPGARDDVPALMQGFDLFVLPSIAEGISNTILEAMASGLPVLATRVGGNGELVVPDETGWLIPPADPAAMARAIASVTRDAETLRAFGRAGRKRIEEKFSLTNMVDRYLGVYDLELARRGRTAISANQ